MTTTHPLTAALLAAMALLIPGGAPSADPQTLTPGQCHGRQRLLK